MVAVSGLILQAATPVAGVALVNGTPNIISWTPPNDGLLHRFVLISTQHVTSAETGGQVGFTFTTPDGGASGTVVTFAAAQPGGSFRNIQGAHVQAGQTVQVLQSTALTVGAAVVWHEIWGS